MYLKRLELNGFKSFANKTILEFPKSQKNRFDIAAIIGPNGSGKSNLAEAIRWALGEQSIKALRGKKSKDIIFSGSKEKARLNLAEVILVFNNEDGAAPIDYKEFIITRRIFRNGESEYRLNKSRVRLQDILLLLARANFGQKSYSIIGQGMVDQILITSPQERKKFFDEATGIKQYIYKKDTAIRKIEKSQDNLQQAEIALNEISPRLRSLTRQINKLSQRQETEVKLLDLQKKYYGPLLKELDQKTSSLKNKLKTEFRKQKEIEEKLKNWQKESETIVYEKTDQQQQKIQYEYQKILKIKNDCLSQQSVLRGQLIFEQEKEKPGQQKINISVDQEKIFNSLGKVQSQQEKFLEKINKLSKISDLDEIKLLANDILKKINQLLKYFQIDEPGEDKNIEIIEKIQEEKKELEIKIKKFDQELDKINHRLSKFSNEEREKREVLFKWQRKTQDEQFMLNKTNNIISEIRIDLARLETKKENLEQEMENEMDKDLIEEILSSTENLPTTQIEFSAIQKLKHQLELIGGIDPELEKEYPLVKERYEFLNSQNTDLKKTLKSLDEIIEKLNQKIETKFRKSFSQINQEFNRYFKIIFNGGDAKIMLQNTPQPVKELNENNPDSENDEPKTELIGGIEILATPPGKKIKSIEMLSGGERTLTALALLCSIISINQPPFVVLDEVDAALDQENSFRFTEILKELRKHTQFIVITHNQQTIEVSDFLYGVTMGSNGVSKLISLKLED